MTPMATTNIFHRKKLFKKTIISNMP
jgi:hypothetical protein